MGKPQGGLHKKERKERLAKHALNYVRYRRGEVNYDTIFGEVQDLELQGVSMNEIVEARAKAMKEAGMLVK